MYHRKKYSQRLTVIGKRSLACFVALCMLFSFAPTVIAEGIELTEEVITDIIPTVTETETAEEATALSEITEMRDEFSKTFLMSDGTYTQVSYASPVHFEDEDGVFQEIDNRLSVNAMTGKVTTGNGGMNVAFSQSQPQVSINANGHSISWSVSKKEALQNNDNVSLMNISPSYAPFTANVVNVADTQDFKALPAEEQLMSAHKAFSEMKYASLQEGYAVNYTVAPGRVKEDILITSAENNEFVITVNAMGLTAVLGDYRTVIFKNNANETVLTFDVPYMYDANDEFSTDIDITLTPILGGYEITLTADEEWLESEDRVYPVVIDPVYTTSRYGGIVDTMVHTYDSAVDSTGRCACGVIHSTWHSMTVGTEYVSYAGRYITSAGFLRMSDFTAVAGKISDARMRLYLSQAPAADGLKFDIYKINNAWSADINENSYIHLDDELIANDVTLQNEGSSYYCEFEITSATKEVFAGLHGNYGFKIVGDGTNPSVYTYFSSSENSIVASRPYATLNYENFAVDVNQYYYINNEATYTFTREYSGNDVGTGRYDVAENADNDSLLWKVVHYSDGYVVLRNKEDPAAYLSVGAGGYSVTEEITQQQTVPDECLWHIFEYDTDRYVIRNKKTNVILHTDSMGEVRVGSWTDASASPHIFWRMMTQSEYNPRTDITEYVHNLTVDDTFNYDDIPREEGTFADDDNSYTTSAYTGGAVSFGNESLTVTGYGAAKMVFRYKDTTASITVYILSNEFLGTYFIRNVSSNLYLNSKTNNNGDNAVQTEQVQRWIFEMQTDGYYLIRNLPSNKYLKVAGDSSANNQDVKTYEFELDGNNNRIITDGFRFKVETSFYGNKIIVPKTGENNNYVLAWETALIPNGAKIQQREYVQDANKKDEWNFEEFSYNDYNYKLIAVDVYDEKKASYGVDSRDDYFEPVTEIIENNTTGEVFSEYTVRSTDFLSLIKSSEVFVIQAHGGQNYINTAGSFVGSSFYGQDLSCTKLAVFLSCSSGEKDHLNNSLITYVNDSGAETVIGFSDTVNNIDCNQFAKELFDQLLNKEKTITEAIRYIAEYKRPSDMFGVVNDNAYSAYYDPLFIDKIVVVGNGDLKL